MHSDKIKLNDGGTLTLKIFNPREIRIPLRNEEFRDFEAGKANIATCVPNCTLALLAALLPLCLANLPCCSNRLRALPTVAPSISLLLSKLTNSLCLYSLSPSIELSISRCAL